MFLSPDKVLVFQGLACDFFDDGIGLVGAELLIGEQVVCRVNLPRSRATCRGEFFACIFATCCNGFFVKGIDVRSDVVRA